MDKSKAQNTKNSGTRIKEEQIINPFEKKIKRIKEEMDILEPDTLLLKVDPSIDSTKTIEQIQRYYYLINNEISKYFKNETIKKELKKKNTELNKKIEEMIHPKKKNYQTQKQKNKKD